MLITFVSYLLSGIVNFCIYRIIWGIKKWLKYNWSLYFLKWAFVHHLIAKEGLHVPSFKAHNFPYDCSCTDVLVCEAPLLTQWIHLLELFPHIFTYWLNMANSSLSPFFCNEDINKRTNKSTYSVSSKM